MMKSRTAPVFAILLAAALPIAVSTQSPTVHAPDGGTRQILTSIAVPALPNSPFSATVNTEWTRYLDDGSTLVVANHRQVARDSQGRVFQERSSFAPADRGPQATHVTMVEIADPTA